LSSTLTSAFERNQGDCIQVRDYAYLPDPTGRNVPADYNGAVRARTDRRHPVGADECPSSWREEEAMFKTGGASYLAPFQPSPWGGARRPFRLYAQDALNARAPAARPRAPQAQPAGLQSDASPACPAPKRLVARAADTPSSEASQANGALHAMEAPSSSVAHVAALQKPQRVAAASKVARTAQKSGERLCTKHQQSGTTLAPGLQV
jgi:hypothetical protein